MCIFKPVTDMPRRSAVEPRPGLRRRHGVRPAARALCQPRLLSGCLSKKSQRHSPTRSLWGSVEAALCPQGQHVTVGDPALSSHKASGHHSDPGTLPLLH